jgi:hypothetical protein
VGAACHGRVLRRYGYGKRELRAMGVGEERGSGATVVGRRECGS